MSRATPVPAGNGAMSTEAAAFAEAVSTAADRFLVAPEPWRPGAVQDDRCPALSVALAEMGWLELAVDAELLPVAGPAALELGRRLAPLCELDALLGASPRAGELIRYGGGGTRAVQLAGDGGLLVHAVDRAEPVAYGDAQGVHRVLASHPLEPVARGEAAVRTAAWTAATAGYLAGLSGCALDTAVDYVQGRKAFGSTLAALAPVQQRLADAATAARGLRLLAHDTPGRAALAHAAAATVEVAAACQQLVGAVGFTLEFPLQRTYRRARAVQLWSDAFLTSAGVIQA